MKFKYLLKGSLKLFEQLENILDEKSQLLFVQI